MMHHFSTLEGMLDCRQCPDKSSIPLRQVDRSSTTKEDLSTGRPSDDQQHCLRRLRQEILCSNSVCSWSAVLWLLY